MTFCSDNQCSLCCIEADVPLLQEDIDRITALGFYDVYFVSDYNGARVMRKLDGKCIFFQKGECEIYDRRPKRCHFYPLTYDEETRSVKIQNICEYKEDYKISITESKHMEVFINQLKQELEMYFNHNNNNKKPPGKINENLHKLT